MNKNYSSLPPPLFFSFSVEFHTVLNNNDHNEKLEHEPLLCLACLASFLVQVQFKLVLMRTGILSRAPIRLSEFSTSVAFHTRDGNSSEKRQKLAWFQHVTRHDSISRTILQGTLEGERYAVVGRGNAGWRTSKSGHICPCKNC